MMNGRRWGLRMFFEIIGWLFKKPANQNENYPNFEPLVGAKDPMPSSPFRQHGMGSQHLFFKILHQGPTQTIMFWTPDGAPGLMVKVFRNIPFFDGNINGRIMVRIQGNQVK